MGHIDAIVHTRSGYSAECGAARMEQLKQDIEWTYRTEQDEPLSLVFNPDTCKGAKNRDV